MAAVPEGSQPTNLFKKCRHCERLGEVLLTSKGSFIIRWADRGAVSGLELEELMDDRLGCGCRVTS